MALKRESSVSVEGLKELEAALLELPSRATRRNVVKRVLIKAAQPIATAMAANSEHFRKSGKLEESIDVGTKLTVRQARIKKKDKRIGGNDHGDVEVFAGAGKIGYAHLKEFGDFNSPADPYARPAWDAEKGNALTVVKRDLWIEIKKAADRIAKKALRKNKKG